MATENSPRKRGQQRAPQRQAWRKPARPQRRLPQLYELACRHLRRRLERHGEGEVAARLPERCSCTLDQILGDFWPD